MSVSCASLTAPIPIPESSEVVATETIVVEHDSLEAKVAPPAAVFQTRTERKVHGYYAWWTRGLWIDLDLSLYDKLFFFDLTPAADGSIRERNGYPFAWQGLVQRADSFNIPVIPTLALLDTDTLEALFLDPEHRARLLQSSLTLIEESGGAGLHLDYEWFAPAPDTLREGFHSYVDTLAASVSRQFPDAELSMFVPAFHPDGMIDISRIPAAFNEIMVQGYDIHWQTAPNAGPLAPLTGWKNTNWNAILGAMDAEGVERDRLFITVPYYGYEWPVESDSVGSGTRGAARVTTWARLDTLNVPEMHVAATEQAAAFGLRRDRVSGSPYYLYADSTGWHQGWFEDEVSLEAKYRFIDAEGLAGIAVFPIGYDSGLLDGLLMERFGSRLGIPDSTR